jgi:hypothetical protein
MVAIKAIHVLPRPHASMFFRARRFKRLVILWPSAARPKDLAETADGLSVATRSIARAAGATLRMTLKLFTIP